MISASQLSKLRTYAARTMLGSGTVYTYTQASDGIGGGTAIYTASGTVACTVAPPDPRGREGIIADGVRSVSEWTLAMPWGTTAGLRDRVAASGRTFEIRATNEGQTGSIAKMLRCEVVE